MEDHLTYHWWPVEELRNSAAQFYPRTLPLYIDALVAGCAVDDAVEVWDDQEEIK